jgi:negative regulator of sigma E activity
MKKAMLEDVDSWGNEVFFGVVACVIVAVAIFVVLYIDKEQNPEEYMRYQTICVNNVAYIQDNGSSNTPLVPSYKADGTINTCDK